MGLVSTIKRLFFRTPKEPDAAPSPAPSPRVTVVSEIIERRLARKTASQESPPNAD